MARETGEISRDIAATRSEIDEHLRELSGRVRGGLDVRSEMRVRARRNLPVLLGGIAVVGLAAGILAGGRRRQQRKCTPQQIRESIQEIAIP